MSSAQRAQYLVSRLDRWSVGGHGLGQVSRTTFRMLVSHDLPGLAADITYHATLTLLPFLLLIVSLPSVTGTVLSISDPSAQISQKVDELFSGDMAANVEALLSEVEQSRGWTALALGLTGTLWAGTSTTSTIRKALNRMYGYDEECPFWKRKAIEALLTVLAGTTAVLAIITIIVGPGLFGLTGLLSEAFFLLAGVLAILLLASLYYWLAPARRNGFNWITPGAALFAIAWVAFSFGFSFYLSNVSNLNHVYGTLGVVAITIIWLYWSAFMMLLGAEINAVLAHHFDPEVNVSDGIDQDAPPPAASGRPAERA